MSKELNTFREKLDLLDQNIVRLLAERDELIAQVAAYKSDEADAIRDLSREEELLGRVVRASEDLGLSPDYVTRLFREILDHSVRRQQRFLVQAGKDTSAETLTIGFQGREGSYSSLAGARHFASYDEEFIFRGYDTFRDVIDALLKKEIDRAFLPIENTTAGSINQCYDLLAENDLAVIGEEVYRIEHCLLALEEVPLTRIRRVVSQAEALAQCTDFLRKMGSCQSVAFTDTALSAKKVHQDQDLAQAAIASERAAEIYGLKVLARDVANQKKNYTRFAVIALEQVDFDRRIPCKTSLILATRHKEGALMGCLQVLTDNGLNLTKLESRPRPGSPWEYLFYLDFEGNFLDDQVRTAIHDLEEHTCYLKVLGSYPSRNTESNRPAVPQHPNSESPS